MCYPRPVQQHVPILVGGSGPRRTLRLVARYADACNLTGEPDSIRAALAVLHRHCADVGRDPADIEVTHLSTIHVVPDGAVGGSAGGSAGGRPAAPGRGAAARGRTRVVSGTVEDHVLRIEALRRAGVQHVIVAVDDVWEDGAVEALGALRRASAFSS
jgi:alkanesulfonate monooxygenase SsuD/methylene tetrahydromethanopterin reductase-like flavin-dependent oxidoreductase (luciferase family)